jgi:hypothetical protein
MDPNKSVPEPWLSFLRELDSAVETEIRLDCMGGFVVTKDRDDVKYLAKTVPLDLEVLRQRYQKDCAGNSVIQSARISRCVFGSKRLRRREKSKRAVRDRSCQIIKRIPKSILRLPIEKRAEIALREAVKGVIEEHARLGLPLYIDRKGKVVELPPAEVRALARSRRRK